MIDTAKKTERGASALIDAAEKEGGVLLPGDTQPYAAPEGP